MEKVLHKRPSISSPEELLKSLDNFTPDIMMKAQKQDDYFLNDTSFDALKPLQEHSITNHSPAQADRQTLL